MNKVVSCSIVISMVWCLSHAEENPNMKETTMQTQAESSKALATPIDSSEEAKKALEKLEEEKKIKKLKLFLSSPAQ